MVLVQITINAENMVEYSPISCLDHQQGGEDDRTQSFYLFRLSTRRRI